VETVHDTTRTQVSLTYITGQNRPPKKMSVNYGEWSFSSCSWASCDVR